MFQFSLAIGYVLASLHVVWPLLREQGISPRPIEKKVLNWIKVDIFLKLFSFSGVLGIFIFFWAFPPSFHSFHFYAFFSSSLLSAVLLLLHPEVLIARNISVGYSDKPQAGNTTSDAGVHLSLDSTKTGRVESVFSAALKEIFEEHYANEALDIPFLARLMHLSERSLYRKTKESFGKSPAQAILDFRMGKAGLIIQKDPNMPIAQVAREVGIANYGSFSAAFSERFGMLPREFQKKCKTGGHGSSESL